MGYVKLCIRSNFTKKTVIYGEAIVVLRFDLVFERKLHGRDGFMGVITLSCMIAIEVCLIFVSFVSLSEEALFRGYLQPRLSIFLHSFSALIIATVAFGLMHHASDVSLMIFATLAGVVYEFELQTVGYDAFPCWF